MYMMNCRKNKLRTHHVNISKDLVTKGFLTGVLYQTRLVSIIVFRFGENDNTVRVIWNALSSYG